MAHDLQRSVTRVAANMRDLSMRDYRWAMVHAHDFLSAFALQVASSTMFLEDAERDDPNSESAWEQLMVAARGILAAAGTAPTIQPLTISPSLRTGGPDSSG